MKLDKAEIQKMKMKKKEVIEEVLFHSNLTSSRKLIVIILQIVIEEFDPKKCDFEHYQKNEKKIILAQAVVRRQLCVKKLKKMIEQYKYCFRVVQEIIQTEGYFFFISFLFNIILTFKNENNNNRELCLQFKGLH